MLTFTALPKPKLVIEPQNPVFIGETITLQCGFRAHSQWTYKWHKDNSSEPFNTSATNTTIIRQVSSSDGGHYRCQGEKRQRAVSSQMSNEVRIQVKGEYVHYLSFCPQCQKYDKQIKWHFCLFPQHCQDLN